MIQVCKSITKIRRWEKKMFIFICTTLLIVLAILYLPINYMNKVKKIKLLHSLNEEIPVTKIENLVYKKAGKKELSMDVYSPKQIPHPLPVIFFVHGEGPEFFIKDAKNWTLYENYGRLLASLGYVAVTFNHSRAVGNWSRVKEASEDIVDAISYAISRKEEFHIDIRKICVWTFSMGGIYLGPLLNQNQIPLSCIVSYYGFLDLEDAVKNKSDQDYFKPFISKYYIKDANHIPTLIVDAKNDSKKIRDAINRFTVSADEQQFPYDYLLHQTGRHAFDAFDDNEETVAVIDKTLDFIKANL
jgi:dienelactone hydrolase